MGATAVQRANLCVILIRARADIDCRDDKDGRTPFHLAAGTGVVDVTRVLGQEGCDIFATATDGRNAADRAGKSSGQMRWPPGVLKSNNVCRFIVFVCGSNSVTCAALSQGL